MKELSKEIFEAFWVNMGHRPASAVIDIPKMINSFNNSGQTHFTFFKNKHNLVWLVNEETKKRFMEKQNLGQHRFYDNITIEQMLREHKLNSLLDI